MRIDSILEYTHRVLAALTAVALGASAAVGWHCSRSMRWVTWPPVIAVALLLLVVALGAMVVLRGLEPGLAALDLGSALMVLTLMLTATVVAFSRRSNPKQPDRLSLRSGLARLSLGALVAVFVVLVSGVLVAEGGSAVRCLGWPLYCGQWTLGDVTSWPHLARRLLAGATGVLVIAVVAKAWRTHQRFHRTATAMGTLFLAETVVGAQMVWGGSTVLLQVVYVTLAAAFWSSLVILVVLAGLPSSAPTGESGIAE
jgi:cytochrome c oxidase assembly protein subunit 15